MRLYIKLKKDYKKRYKEELAALENKWASIFKSLDMLEDTCASVDKKNAEDKEQ